MDQKLLEDHVPGYKALMLRYRIGADGLLFGSVPLDTPEPEPPALSPEDAIDERLARALAALEEDTIH